MKFLSRAAFAAGVTAAVFAVSSVPADARCNSCQHASRTIVKTNYNYKTVQQVRHVTKYRDVTQVRHVNQVHNVTKTNYVNVVHRTVNVTRLQPVTHVNVVTRVHPVTNVHVVTRVHHQTVYQNSRQSMSQVVHLDGRTIHSNSTAVMPVRMVSHYSTVNVGGGSRHVWCGC